MCTIWHFLKGTWLNNPLHSEQGCAVNLATNHVMARRWRSRLAAGLAAALLAACGGGGGGGGDSPSVQTPNSVVTEKPASRDEAARFLTQATFGPVDTDIDRVLAVGYAAWIDEQLALPVASHRATFEAADVVLKAAGSSAGADQVLDTFWQQAVSGPDQLRQRVAYALQQIFVISLADGNVAENPRAVAAWMDMLATDGLGNYRNLLEQVSRHPMMGLYLTHLKNQKADARTGRVPDENYAREVMQLFSIGLVELNDDGTAKTGTGGASIDTYGPADIAGLAKVFTGWSWACPDWPDNSCFYWGNVNGVSDPDAGFKPMLGYPQYHSTEAKAFLGSTIAAQGQANPDASLKSALDTLAAHPNVGPFIGRQLIQRLVTSNPSPAYVRAVGQAFNNNGAGVRGDMKAVVKAVLMNPEARQAGSRAGKVREPVLRLSAFLRAFGHTSDSGRWRVGNTDSTSNALGQSPMRSPSVFNFYRPGYVAPGTAAAGAGLVSPEMQIAHETSAAGYVNYMRDAVQFGVGASNGTLNGVVLNRRDLQGNYTAELALADQPVALVDRVAGKLMYGTAPAALKTEVSDAITQIAIPVLNNAGSNQASIDSAKRSRVNAAVLLLLASPEFQVQK